jgi:hypothetical protein
MLGTEDGVQGLFSFCATVQQVGVAEWLSIALNFMTFVTLKSVIKFYSLLCTRSSGVRMMSEFLSVVNSQQCDQRRRRTHTRRSVTKHHHLEKLIVTQRIKKLFAFYDI